MKKTFFLFIFIVTSIAQAQECFHPERDENIRSFFTPNRLRTSDKDFKIDKRLNEDEEIIKKIHAKIREGALMYHYDPRLIYGHMLGESQADPFKPQGDGGAGYGLFQFSNHSFRRQCDQSKNHPRLCQVNYYVDVYMRNWAQKSLNAKGCPKGKQWMEFSTIDKASYLDLGQCGLDGSLREKCLTGGAYQWTKGCKLIMQVIDWKAPRKEKQPDPPLCDDYLSPPKPGESPIIFDMKMKTDL